MSRKQKKRNKAYTGTDAAPAGPTVRRYSAITRSPIGEWWQDHKKTVKIGSGIGGTVLVVGYLLFELARLVF